MSFELLAIDLGKRFFHLHGIGDDGSVFSRKACRTELLAVVTELAPAIIAMEACPGAHDWGRRFQRAGFQVRLIHPRFVKAFVRGAKNDAVDAEAIYEAASRPTMRFVPLKTEAQQDLQAAHRVRDRLISQRTALINQTRGLLAEYRIVLAKGPARLIKDGPEVVAAAPLSDLARDLFGELFEQLNALHDRIGKMDARSGDHLSEECRMSASGDLARGWARGRNRADRQYRPWAAFPKRARACGLDRPGAATTYYRRKAETRRHWQAGQPLSASADDPWRPIGGLSCWQA
jgi:transposase